jgi:membrane-associated protease RseP (regulator of RpoE activity)
MKLKRDVLFAAWSGEELGLLGSGNFIQSYLDRGNNSRGSARRIAAYLNMDMIGRLSDKLYLQGVGSSSVWKGEIERYNVAVGLPVVTQDDSYLPTDTTSFYLKGVPVLNAFTGAHRDYNTPRDTPDRINYQGTARIAQLMGSILASLAIREEAPDYIATKKPTGSSTRRNLRAYMGTIPDYGDTDVKGVRLNGVAESGPASKAGLKGGDIIVELAGRTIENIYDYTYALNALKIGETVEIVVTRAGQRKRLTITPESRE